MISGSTKTEKEYRDLEIDSSSSLKEFSLDRKKYYKKYILAEKVADEEESKASVVGRLVDTLLLEKDEFDNRFAMSSIAKAPSGNMVPFIESLYRNTIEPGSDFQEAIKQAYKDSGYKISFEKVVEKFSGSDAEIYYKELLEVRSKGLTVVTADDITNAENIVNELKTNQFTADVINCETDSRYLVQNQVKIEDFDIDDLPLKSMMDKVIIDHKKKSIQCYDLKCVWTVENFYDDYYLYRRAYIQAYVYYQACYKIKEELELDYYNVEFPKFIVCDSINYYNPLIYSLSTDDLTDAYMGFEAKGRKYPGLGNIIKDLIWAKKNGIWNISRTNYLNNGLVNLKN